MPTDCVIIFDHPSGVYNSGDTLNGQVKLQTDISKSIRGISIKVVGYGKVFWRESAGKSSRNFKSYEQYLNSVTYVIGSDKGHSFDLEAGIYEYTFTCELPKELPTSMKDDIGKIKYKVIVTIDRPIRFNNVFKKDFIVLQTLNLNLNLNDKLPKRITGIMEIAPFFGCCFLNSTDIKAELKIPCSGYVPGQILPFQLIVYNDSNINLSGAKVKLIKCCTYKSSEPYEKEKKTVDKIKIRNCDNIPRYTNKEFKYSFQVPYLPPTNRTRFTTFTYKLKATINVFGYSIQKFYIEIPITIGTVPFVDFEPNC